MKFGDLAEGVILAWLMQILTRCSAYTTQYTASGDIQAETFKYFRVFMEGNIRLELLSLSGDADLYVSDVSETPTVSDYDLSSASCGVEVVDVPSTFHRPVGVGVFAYPSYLNCSFFLSVTKLPDTDESDPWVSNFEALYRAYDKGYSYVDHPSSSQDKTHTSHSSEASDDEPFWWKLLITLLKIIVDAAL